MFPQIDTTELAGLLIKLLSAYALAFPVGWDREARARGAGLRTFPLVALGSCAYVLLGIEMMEGSESQARILYGLMTGIGFIGGGSILKSSGAVHGTATAASIWNTGAIGAAIAWNRYDLALVLSAINFATLRLGRPLKRYARQVKQTEGSEESDEG